MTGCATSGSGVYDFKMMNTFHDAIIWAFAGTEATPTALASTQPIVSSDATQPARGHLARTQLPSEMRVIWHSAFDDADAMVMWGTTPGGPYS